MQVFFEAVRAEPWPFIAAGILLICLLSQVFADSSDADLPGLGDQDNSNRKRFFVGNRRTLACSPHARGESAAFQGIILLLYRFLLILNRL